MILVSPQSYNLREYNLFRGSMATEPVFYRDPRHDSMLATIRSATMPAIEPMCRLYAVQVPVTCDLS
jgi:hypothetical protein